MKEKFLKVKRKIIPIGSSKGIIIPKEILKLLEVKNGNVELKIKLK